ncbi:Crp/Fnr family transcriptional regulator [Angelakisella massiliensis]|uniref:Crp/Fnr family transcriptional regulator n=1 Tax=Angelakisella massiliensis TaxID=1871018 RepID=UPI0008F8CC17|nr:Crp/Fnr family transcriptional regulator [Angelakisella massiliensis]
MEFAGKDRQRGIHFNLKDSLKPYRELFLQRFVLRKYPAGYLFNMAGFPPVGLFYLVEGEVHIYTTSSQGDIRFIGIHRENTLFNLDSFRCGCDAVITSKAFGPVQALPITQQQLFELMAEYPQLGRDLLCYVGDVLRLMCYDAEAQSIHDVKTRLIRFLLVYSADSHTLVVPLSQYSIACAINASRIQVARVCGELKQAGLIQIRRGKILLTNRETLEQYEQQLLSFEALPPQR